MMKKRKLTIISEAFPPLVIGSPILLFNLFNEYDDPLSAIAGWQYGAKNDPNFSPPCPTDYIRMPNEFLQRIYGKFKRQLLWFTKFLIKKHLRKHKPDIAFIVCPDGVFFVAAALACEALNIPYLVHMHDLWSDNLPENSRIRLFADRYENTILREANVVFAMTKMQKELLDRKYGINCNILPHTIPSNQLNNSCEYNSEKTKRNTKQILYSGNISQAMNLDAVQQFVKAVDLLPENYKVKMFISWNKKQRKLYNVHSERIEYKWLSREEVLQQIKESDALILPLSFKNAAMKEVKTVFATKTLEYLISGVPIIVFSPKESFHSVSANENGWGYVVDKDDPVVLKNKIIKLTNDAEMSSKLVGMAQEEAKKRNSSIYTNKLEEIVRKMKIS